MMTSKPISIICAGVFVWALTGCDKIGQTSAGGSDADVKAAFDKLPIEERAKVLMSSPASAEFKAKKIKELYAKEGKPVPANLPGGGGEAH